MDPKRRWKKINFKRIQRKLLFKLIRKNNYNTFPGPVNLVFESVWKCQFRDVWEDLFDSFLILNTSYAHKILELKDERGNYSNNLELIEKLMPTDPNFVYKHDLPYNMFALLYDVWGAWYVKDKKANLQRKTAAILIDKLNGVNRKRIQNFKLVLSYWIRTLNIKCDNLMDEHVCKLIVKYHVSMVFDEKKLLLTVEMYHMIQTWWTISHHPPPEIIL